MPLFFFSLFACVLVILSSPSFLPLIENDSFSYINNESIRLSLYPYLIDLFGENLKMVIYFQIILFSVSIASIVLALKKKKICSILIFIFLFLILVNIYYTSFTKTILTESLFISFINLSVAVIIVYKDTKFKNILSILLGLFLGLIISIRHEALIIALFISCMLIYFEISKNNKRIIIFLLMLLTVPTFEINKFYSENITRDSVIEKIIKGKIFMLSGFEDFDYSRLSHMQKSYIDESVDSSKKINSFLNQIKNPYLRNNLYSDYEVVAQYQLDEFANTDIFENGKYTIEFEKNLLIDIIKSNPTIFIKLSLHHYLTLWMPGGKQIFLDKSITKNKSEIPFDEVLMKSSGEIKSLRSIFILLGLIFFQILMIFSVISLVSVMINLFNKRFTDDIYFSCFTLIIHSHLLAISFLNIGSPRYLMPVYSLILICLILALDKYLIKKYK